MKFFNRIQYRLLAVILFVVLVPLIGTGLYGNWITSKILREDVLGQSLSESRQAAKQIETFLVQVSEDVLFLAELSSLHSLLQARSDGDEESIAHWRQVAAEDFIALSRQRGIYDQIRYISEDGLENIRVDSDGFQVYRISDEELQDKAHRYYFSEAIDIPQGAISISPLDLNREFGEIEMPHQPVIRYATPIFDQEDERRGLVIVNVFAVKFLDIVQDMNRPRGSAVFLTDQHGFYMVHPDTGREWGGPNDLDTGYRLQEDYPTKHTAILAGEPGALVADRALIYTLVHPDPNNRSRFWTLVYDGSLEILFSPIWQFRYTAIFILILAMVVAAVMAFWLAKNLTEPIRSLREGVERLRYGMLDEPVKITSEDEIGDLANAFNEMAQQLDLSQRQRRQLLDRVITAQEDERKLVAYDIHDGLIQRLVGARLQLSNYIRIRDKVIYENEVPSSDESLPESDDSVLEQRRRDIQKADFLLQRSNEHLGAAIAEGRQLIEGLRPTMLDDFGLVAAVRILASQICDIRECQLQFESNCDDERFSPTVEITGYRIAQEALSNVRRHAQSSKLLIEMMHSDQVLVLLFQDWGVGFDISSKRDLGACVGLVSMRERSSLLGGRFELDSAPGNGTMVRVTLPLDEFSTSPPGSHAASEDSPTPQ